MKSFLRHQLPFIAYALLIFILSSFEKLPSPKVEFEFFDKLVHFVEFFIFSILALRASAKWAFLKTWKWPLLTPFLISLIYAASDEIHQFFVPGRDCDLYDFWADAGGIVLGLIIYHFIKQLQDR